MAKEKKVVDRRFREPEARRSERISLPLTAREKRDIENKADRAGITVSELIRRAVLLGEQA